MDYTNYPNDKTNKLRYIAYLRKSTEDAEKQVMSIGSQLERIKTMFPKLDITFYDGEPDDKGKLTHGEQKSAFKPGRPLFNKMLRDIEKSKFDGIIAWHPDRLSRNEIDAANITWRIREGTIKDLKFCSYHFDKSEEGIMMLQMTMTQSQYQSAKLSKDVKRGMATKRKSGGICGTAPTGYLNDKIKNKIYPDPKRFPLLRKAFDLMLTGDYSVQQILDITNNEWGYTTFKRKKTGGKPLSRTALYNIFTNMRYAGKIVRTTYDEPGEPFDADFPAMITVDEYNRIQDLLGRKGKPRLCKSKKTFALKGFIRCGECGCMITAENTTKKLKDGGEKIHTYYHCTYKKKDHKCSQRQWVTEDDLYSQLEDLLSQYELSPELYKISMEALNELAKKEISERDDIQAMQFESTKDIQAQLDKLTKMAMRDMLPLEEYEVQSKELRDKLATLDKEKAAVSERVKNWYEIVGTTLGEIVNANERFVNGDIIEKKHILLSLGQNPVLTEGKLSLDEFYWLQPVKKNVKQITGQLEKVRTEPLQIQKASFEAVCQSWRRGRDSNPR